MIFKVKNIFFYLLISFVIWAEPNKTLVIGQKDKAFTNGDDGKPIENIKIKIGDSISFRNDDSFFHNIYSLSDVQIFDLGSYPKGEHRTVKFKKAGIVKIQCAIHPKMKLVVEVKK